MSVDLSPVINAALSLAGIGIITIGTWAIHKAAGYLGVQQNNAAIAGLDDALTRAVHDGASVLESDIKTKGWDNPDVRNAIVSVALTYLTSKAVPALKAAGLDPADPSGATTRYLTDELNRIFPTAIAPVAASPVTPPVQAEQKP